MDELFIPTLHTFENNNIFTGSLGRLRFKITPAITMMPSGKEVNFEESSMKAEYWYGLLCYEKSKIEEEKVFPLTQEGRTAMQQWLQEKA